MDTFVPTQDWIRAVAEASRRTSPEQAKEFLALVDQAAGTDSPVAAAALLATFNAEPDYGTQERVCSVLASADERVLADAIVAELPRLQREAPEWAEVLLGEQVTWRADALVAAIESATDAARKSAIDLLFQTSFSSFYSRAAEVRERVGA
jgi:hypothetical protein